MIDRILELNELQDDSLFLWGARQTGKSTFLRQKYPDARYYDLLLPREYQRLQRNPDLLIDELSLADEGELVRNLHKVLGVPAEAVLAECHWGLPPCEKGRR